MLLSRIPNHKTNSVTFTTSSQVPYKTLANKYKMAKQQPIQTNATTTHQRNNPKPLNIQ